MEQVIKLCSVEGCNRPHHAKGLCKLHYGRLTRTGDTVRINNIIDHNGHCSVEGCTKPIKCKNLCVMHYWRWRIHNRLYRVNEISGNRLCSIEGCNEPVRCKGFCRKHYQQDYARRQRAKLYEDEY